MIPTSAHESIDTATWKALRSLLIGDARGLEPSADLAHAASLGEVEVLVKAAMPEIEPWLHQATSRRVQQGILIAFAEERVQELMESAGVGRWVALKGSSSAHTLYSEASQRARRDVDLLIAPGDMTSVYERALEMGWEDVTHASHFAAAGQDPYERELLIPIGTHRVGCDLHQRLMRWREFPVEVSEMLDRSVMTPSGWRVCDDADLLIHTALHAANATFQLPLRSLFDIHLLVSSGRLNWLSVSKRARQWRARRCLWLALRITERWFQSQVPEEVMKELSPPTRQAQRLEHIFSGEGQWACRGKVKGRLMRSIERCMLRERKRDAGAYLWQTIRRELSLVRASK